MLTHSELDGLPSVLQEIMTNHRVRQTARADPMAWSQRLGNSLALASRPCNRKATAMMILK